MTDLSTALVCFTVLVLVLRATPFFDRLVAIREGELALKSAPTPRQEQVSLPDDLYALAQSYEDTWAREQAMQSMREMYAELGSWDRVRVNFALHVSGTE